MKIYKDEVINRYFVWYAPGEITFHPDEVRFLLEHYEVLAQGRYPAEPTGNYVEIRYVKTIHPSWNHASNLKAELDYRLERVPKDAREALMFEVGYQLLSPPANRVLKYISGWRRKREPYRQWQYDYKKSFDDKTHRKTK